MNERWVAFGGSRVQLRWAEETWRPLAEFLLQAVADPGPLPEAHVTMFLSRHPESRAWQLAEQMGAWGSAPPAPPRSFPAHVTPYEPASYLLSRLCYHLAYHSGPGLLFHAGAVIWGGRLLLIAGGMGAGKSTLTAWLTARGGRYLSDELAFWPAVDQPISGFPRPLNLRRDSWLALQPWLRGHDLSTLGLHHPRYGSLLPAQALLSSGLTGGDGPDTFRPGAWSSADLDGAVCEGPGDLGLPLILFPRYQSGATLTIEALSSAQTGKGLMEVLVNGRNLPGHGFGLVAQLAACTPGWRLTYGSFDQLDEEVWQL